MKVSKEGGCYEEQTMRNRKRRKGESDKDQPSNKRRRSTANDEVVERGRETAVKLVGGWTASWGLPRRRVGSVRSSPGRGAPALCALPVADRPQKRSPRDPALSDWRGRAGPVKEMRRAPGRERGLGWGEREWRWRPDPDSCLARGAGAAVRFGQVGPADRLGPAFRPIK